TGIGHRLQRQLRSGLREKIQILGIVRASGEMGVTVDETGQDGHFAEVDDFGVGRHCYVVAYRLDFAVADEDGLACENSTRVGVDQLTCADCDRLSTGGYCKKQTKRK